MNSISCSSEREKVGEPLLNRNTIISTFLVTILLAWAAANVSGTNPELSTTIGDTVNIPCLLMREGTLRYILIRWYYNSSTGHREILIFANGELTKASEYEHRASLSEDFSTLILTEITVADEGTYHCVVDRQKQTALPNFKTKLNVFSLRPDTFPVISPCNRFGESASCNIHANQSFTIQANQSFTLTCTLPNVYPVEDVELIWYRDGKRVLSIHDVTQNDDGTTDIMRQIHLSETGNITCNATFLSAKGQENTAASVEALITPIADVPNPPGWNMTSVPIAWKKMCFVLFAVIVMAIIALLIYSWKSRARGPAEQEVGEILRVRGPAEQEVGEILPVRGPAEQEVGEILPVRADSLALMKSSTVELLSRQTEEPRKQDFDDILTKIARSISSEGDIQRLGMELDFEPGQIQRYTATNIRLGQITHFGTLSMLRHWRNNIDPSEASEKLKIALTRIDQNILVDL